MKKTIKNSIKSLFLILMIMIVALTFSACAQVRAMTITNVDDTIDELVTVTIIPQEILNAGYNLSELKLDIETKSEAQAETMKNNLNQKIFMDLMTVFDNESRETLNSYKDGIEVIKSEWNNNTYAVGIRFKNIDVYKYYYSIKDDAKPEMQTKEHFFYDKVYYYASTMYVKHHDLYDSINDYYSNKYDGLVNSETNELLYTYKTNLRRQHSDADYITYEKGEYYHTWVVDPQNLDEPIMLYYNIANPENWIIVGICITLAVTVVLIVVGLILNLNKKQNDSNQVLDEKKDDEN